MAKFAKFLYYIKLLLLIISMYFIFTRMHNYLDTGIYGLVFLLLYILYVLLVVVELFNKKNDYQTDIIYTFMQIGFLLYILIVSIKCSLSKVYVTTFSYNYFKINYIILSILLIFIFIYKIADFKGKKKFK